MLWYENFQIVKIFSKTFFTISLNVLAIVLIVNDNNLKYERALERQLLPNSIGHSSTFEHQHYSMGLWSLVGCKIAMEIKLETVKRSSE